MRRVMCGGVLAAFLAAGVGCSGQSEPTQPKFTDDQLKELMKQGKEQSQMERGGGGKGDTRGGLGPR